MCWGAASCGLGGWDRSYILMYLEPQKMGATAVGFLGLVVRPWHGSLPWERKDRTRVRRADLPKTGSKKQGVTGTPLWAASPNTAAHTAGSARGFLSILSSFLDCWCALDVPKLCQTLHV